MKWFQVYSSFISRVTLVSWETSTEEIQSSSWRVKTRNFSWNVKFDGPNWSSMEWLMRKSFRSTYHPSGRVKVNPNCGSVATEILIPVSPLPSGVITCPLITETRLSDNEKKKKWLKVNFVFPTTIWFFKVQHWLLTLLLTLR